MRLLSPPPKLSITTQTLALALGVYFALTSNAAYWTEVLRDRPAGVPGTWGYVIATFVVLTVLHFLLALLPMHRRYAKAWGIALLAVASMAGYFMQRYGAYIDPTMVRNALHTDPTEAREVLGWSLVPHLLVTFALPAWLVSRVTLVRRPWPRALLRRVAGVAVALVVAAAALLAVFQDVGSMMRNRKELRYLITPTNAVYSSARVLMGTTQEARSGPRQVVGADAKLGATWARPTKPVLFVIVVGETARAANWGLNGYARQTTPQLAARAAAHNDLLNFSDVSACGTNTETSLPCMFSAVGRRDYDERRIRTSESLLHVLARAGLHVLWRDNQAGCKGVCEGLQEERLEGMQANDLCQDGRCFDEILLRDLDQRVFGDHAMRSSVIALHMLGNHGPTYFKRYPKEFARFTPTCDTGDLKRCSVASIVNTYDNALLYTDHVLARVIAWLDSHAKTHDVAMLYISDHGESLGEKGLFLHGVPYAIAPREQLHVPMVWWWSSGFAARQALQRDCMQALATKPWSHDHLFHTLLGLLDVDTSVYERALDVSATCRMNAR